jgi:glycosyltransferase involved in cell wall biosynthesis
VTVTEGLTINDEALKRLRPELDVVHLHWPEVAWRIGNGSAMSELRLVAGLHRFLRLAHRLGLRVWWTVHNLAPHEGGSLINHLGYRVVASHADLVIAHSQFVATEVRRKYRARAGIVMPIGNYAGVYPSPRPREDVMKDLHLNPALPLVACLGTVRRYKGIGTAIDAVARLGGRVQLLVAGDPFPDAGAQEIEAAARNAPWLRVLLRRVSDREFSDFASASDAILLPYTRAATSSLLLAAWTLGRGAITSDLRCFSDELAAHPKAGTMAPAGNAAEFADSIQRYLSIDGTDRTAAALAAAATREWSQCVLPVVAAMRSSPDSTS